METSYDTAADSVFHQLYDHTLGWADEWLDSEATALVYGDGGEDGDSGWLPWGITKARLILAGAERLLEEQVVMARADGATWRDIGLCMDVHASAAHRWAARRGIEERAAAEIERRNAWVEQMRTERA